MPTREEMIAHLTGEPLQASTGAPIPTQPSAPQGQGPSRAEMIAHLTGETLQAPPTVKVNPETSTASAGLEGFGQGGTFGYLPEMQAAAQKAGQVILPQSMGGAPLGQSEDYSKIKEYFRNRDAQMKSEHPWASGLGNLAGAVATAPMGGMAAKGLGAAIKMIPGTAAAGEAISSAYQPISAAYNAASDSAKAIPYAGKAVPFVEGVGKAAATGAGYGAIMNPEVESDALNPNKELSARLENAKTGAEWGGGISAGASALGAGGRSLYKWGLKNLDLEAAKYGKTAPSEILWNEGVAGSAETIQNKMDELASGYLSQRNRILKDARSGEVDMKAAMQPALDEIYRLKIHGTPEEQQVANILEKRAQAYVKLGGKPSEQILRELPVGGTYTPEHTALDTIRTEGGGLGYKRAAPVTDIAETLPSSKNYVPQYRTLPTQEGSLPLGNVNPQPLGTVAETRYQRSTPALEKMRGPYSNEFKNIINNPEIDVTMGQRIPETTNFKPGEIPTSQTQGPITGQHVPESFALSEPQTVIDETEAKAGPSPAQVNAWKSAGYNRLPQSKYAQAAQTSVGQKIEKIKNNGLKTQIEKTVGDQLGDMKKEELIDLNKKLGSLLTTQDKAEAEAAKEIRRNAVTPVDAMTGLVSAAVTHDPGLTAAAMAVKKAADISKGTAFRTIAGKGIHDISQNPLFIPAATKSVLQSPWAKMKPQEKQ